MEGYIEVLSEDILDRIGYDLVGKEENNDA